MRKPKDVLWAIIQRRSRTPPLINANMLALKLKIALALSSTDRVIQGRPVKLSFKEIAS